MTRYQTLVQLTEDLVKKLDEEAARQRVSRSAVIRDAVAQYLAGSVEKEIGRQIVEGYKRIPPGVPDEWGDLDAAADAFTRETAQRLDAEERRGGKRW